MFCCEGGGGMERGQMSWGVGVGVEIMLVSGNKGKNKSPVFRKW